MGIEKKARDQISGRLFKMVFQLNLDYVRSNRGMIVTAETALAAIGGLIASVLFYGFLSFCFWGTFFISGALLLLNVLNVYQALHAKFAFLTKVEFGYVAVWALFYLIATIMSFISWNIPYIIAYVELVLFALDGFLHFRVYRSGGDAAPAADAETASDDQTQSKENFDTVKKEATSAINKLAGSVAAAAGAVADATKSDEGDNNKK